MKLSTLHLVSASVRAHGRQTSWAKSRAAGGCDECAAVQAEQRGGVRARVTSVRRVFGEPQPIHLCSPHAALWREQDTLDLQKAIQ